MTRDPHKVYSVTPDTLVRSLILEAAAGNGAAITKSTTPNAGFIHAVLERAQQMTTLTESARSKK